MTEMKNELKTGGKKHYDTSKRFNIQIFWIPVRQSSKLGDKDFIKKKIQHSFPKSKVCEFLFQRA